MSTASSRLPRRTKLAKIMANDVEELKAIMAFYKPKLSMREIINAAAAVADAIKPIKRNKWLREEYIDAAIEYRRINVWLHTITASHP